MLPTCGHTFCLECLSKMRTPQNYIRCPLDQGLCLIPGYNVDMFPTNILIRQIAEYRALLRDDLCSEHEGELKNLVCLTDQRKICKFCVEYGSHCTHSVKYIKDMEVEALTKREYLEGKIREYDASVGQIQELVSQEKLTIIKTIFRKFEEIKSVLERQKLRLLNKVNIVFDQRRCEEEFSDSYRQSLQEKEKYKRNIEILKNLKIDPEFFAALHEDLAEISVDSDCNDFREQSEALKIKLNEDLHRYSNAITEKVKSLNTIENTLYTTGIYGR